MEEVMTEAQAAEVLKIKHSTLAKLRKEGKGPPYAMVGGSIRYIREDLIHWVRSQQRRRI